MLKGVAFEIYESCARTVSAAPLCRTSLSYSLSVEFVYVCGSPEPLSYSIAFDGEPHRRSAAQSSRAHTRRGWPSDGAQLLARTGHVALLHSRSRPRPAVHLPHRAGFCSSMPEVQPTHHHRSACGAYGVLNWGYTLRTIAVGSEDRTCVGYVLQGAGRVPVKSSGRGTDAQSVPPKALR